MSDQEQPRKRTKKKPISLTIPKELLDKADASAAAIPLSRAAYINAAISQAVEYGLSLPASADKASHK